MKQVKLIRNRNIEDLEIQINQNLEQMPNSELVMVLIGASGARIYYAFIQYDVKD
ncbi:MAG: hypothetical protein ACFFEN_15775 [Candidatus Thorarchaeota archaeon]